MVAVSTKCSGVGSSRRTHFINRKPASNLFHAIRIAEKIGQPLTHFVTLTFKRADCAPEEVSSRFEKMRDDRFSPWSRRPRKRSGARPVAPTYVWVIEAAGGVISVHWMVHLPQGRVNDFTARLPSWVEYMTDAPINAGAIDVRPAETPKGAGKYMLKGIDPAWAASYRINHISQGVVHGKRSGYSRNLGPTAKRRLIEAGKYRRARFLPPIPYSTAIATESDRSAP